MPRPGVLSIGPASLMLRGRGGVPPIRQRSASAHTQGPEQRWRDLVGSAFLYTAANWGAVTWYLEVYMRSTSAKALARLYNVTAGAEVTGSVVTDDMATDGLTTYSRTRSGALTLTDGNEYMVQFGVQDGGAGGMLGAQLIAV